VLPWVAPAIIWLLARKPVSFHKENMRKKTRMIVYTKIQRLQAIGIPGIFRKKIVITKYYRSFWRQGWYGGWEGKIIPCGQVFC